MMVTRSQIRQIIQEEYTRVLILESPEVQQEIQQNTEEAQVAAKEYGLEGWDWNSIFTTIAGSGITAALKTKAVATAATGVGMPLAALEFAAATGIDAAVLVKAIYEAIQSKRSRIELERVINEITDEYPNVALAGFTFDRPLSREAIEVLKGLPQAQKDRIGLLMARFLQYGKRSIISLINASPDDILSGALAASLAVMPLEEAIISLSQLSAEVIEIVPWIDKLLRMDNFASKALHTVLNRVMWLNFGRIATAIGMLNPTALDRLPDAPEMDFTPQQHFDDETGEPITDVGRTRCARIPDCAKRWLDEDDSVEDESQQVPIPFPTRPEPVAALRESFSYDRIGLLAGIKR
jgi:hypothetical protein